MRNKKQATPEPTPEEVAVEQHVEAMMNPRPTEGPLDIFKGMPTEKIPLGGSPKPVTSAPTVPGKPLPKPSTEATSGKSLFSSVDALKRDDADSTPVTVSIKPKLTAVPVPLSPKPSAPAAPVTPIVASPPKAISLGSNPSAATDENGVVRVDRLARKDAYTDSATETAVDDIMAKEGDDLLAAEDAARKQAAVPVFKKTAPSDKWRKILKNKWTLLVIPLLLVILAAIPVTRYKLASLVIKKDLIVTVVDSQTGKPVSGASVDYNGLTAKTNPNGQAQLQVPLGDGQLAIAKGYYKAFTQQGTIGLGGASPTITVKLVATGRQVPLTLVNKLTKKPLGGVSVKVLGTSAVSDKTGKVSIVLPTKTATAKATFSASGYNTIEADVEITDAVVTANSFAMVPTGSLYFLSNTSGKLDVVKTNLDGSGRTVILAGTGSEDPATTSVVASRDWRYVVVRSKRDANQTSLSLIDTSTDKVTQFEQSTAAYTPIGWSGHNFVYDVVRTSQAQSQSGRESLKSYNADQQQLNQLDQTTATGTSASYAYQGFNNFFIVDTAVVYNVQWYAGGSPAYDLASQTNVIRSISAAGSGKKDLQTYEASTLANIQAAHVLPGTVDYGIYTTDNKSTFYAYTNGAITSDGSVTAASFNNAYPVYLLSPDGTKTLWSDQKAGKQSLVIGDKNATNVSTLTPASEYTAYGWYTNQYLLYARAGTGLYIVPITGTTTGTPVKVSDYAQKVIAPSSYGGGF